MKSGEVQLETTIGQLQIDLHPDLFPNSTKLFLQQIILSNFTNSSIAHLIPGFLLKLSPIPIQDDALRLKILTEVSNNESLKNASKFYSQTGVVGLKLSKDEKYVEYCITFGPADALVSKYLVVGVVNFFFFSFFFFPKCIDTFFFFFSF